MDREELLLRSTKGKKSILKQYVDNQPKPSRFKKWIHTLKCLIKQIK